VDADVTMMVMLKCETERSESEIEWGENTGFGNYLFNPVVTQ
jgi:hypothetical protein